MFIFIMDLKNSLYIYSLIVLYLKKNVLKKYALTLALARDKHGLLLFLGLVCMCVCLLLRNILLLHLIVLTLVPQAV